MRYCICLAMLSLICLPGCLRVKVDPVEVKPITLNVNLKIDRELDDFFAFEEQMAPAPPVQTPAPIQTTPAPTPTTPIAVPESPAPATQTPAPLAPPVTPAPAPGNNTIAVPEQFEETR